MFPQYKCYVIFQHTVQKFWCAVKMFLCAEQMSFLHQQKCFQLFLLISMGNYFGSDVIYFFGNYIHIHSTYNCCFNKSLPNLTLPNIFNIPHPNLLYSNDSQLGCQGTLGSRELLPIVTVSWTLYLLNHLRCRQISLLLSQCASNPERLENTILETLKGHLIQPLAI